MLAWVSFYFVGMPMIFFLSWMGILFLEMRSNLTHVIFALPTRVWSGL